MGSAVTIILKPKMITTAKELRDYPISQRKCYFKHERRLKYFEQYTPTNCEIECEADKVLEKCNCLPIYIESDTDGIATCGFANFKSCLEVVKLELVGTNFGTCNCLPTCTTVIYDAEIVVTTLNMSISSKFQEELRIYVFRYIPVLKKFRNFSVTNTSS
jgi:acid-sensing ion channel, other